MFGKGSRCPGGGSGVLGPLPEALVTVKDTTADGVSAPQAVTATMRA